MSNVFKIYVPVTGSQSQSELDRDGMIMPCDVCAYVVFMSTQLVFFWHVENVLTYWQWMKEIGQTVKRKTKEDIRGRQTGEEKTGKKRFINICITSLWNSSIQFTDKVKEGCRHDNRFMNTWFEIVREFLTCSHGVEWQIKMEFSCVCHCFLLVNKLPLQLYSNLSWHAYPFLSLFLTVWA